MIIKREQKVEAIRKYFARPMPYLHDMHEKELDEFYSYVKFMNNVV